MILVGTVGYSYKDWRGVAYQGLTHKREEAEESLPQFRAALSALQEAGKLAGVLLQFPNSFRKNDENRDYLRWLRQGLSPAYTANPWNVTEGSTFPSTTQPPGSTGRS